jgi:hypothetical protein
MGPLIDNLGEDLSQSIRHVEGVPTEACNSNGKIVQELLYEFWRRLEIKGSPNHKNIESFSPRFGAWSKNAASRCRGASTTRFEAVKRRGIERPISPQRRRTIDDAIESLKQLGDIAAWYFFKYFGETPPDSVELAKAETARRPEPAPAAQSLLRIAILYKRKTSDEDVIGRQDEQVLDWLETNFELPATPYLSIDTWSSGSSGTRAPTSLPPVVQAYSGDRLCHRRAPLHHRYESIALQC